MIKLEYNKKFDFDEANASAEDIIKYLASDEKECFAVSNEYEQQIFYDIIVIRYAIKGNRYSQYMTTTIAKDVNDANRCIYE